MAKVEAPVSREGIGLCLSGGGFRATLFHVGALWRLNELGYLKKLDRISSVSGGSITAGWLGKCWGELRFDKKGVSQNFIDVFVAPLREFAARKLDLWLVLTGLLNPFSSIGESLVESYRKYLFGGMTLQDLPDAPEFVITASNAQTGALFRFSRKAAADYKIGEIKNPKIELAIAVAASSAFPPFFSPVMLNLGDKAFSPNKRLPLQKPPYTTRVFLMDGGVYDNLGLEPVIKKYDTVLISDAGGAFELEPRPKHFWGFQAYRALMIMDNQVRSLRKRDIIDSFKSRTAMLDYMRKHKLSKDETLLKRVSRNGTYWGTFTNIADYDLKTALPCPHASTLKLARLTTRLWQFPNETQERLINWGYAVCDAAMRKHIDPRLPNNAEFPYKGGVG